MCAEPGRLPNGQEIGCRKCWQCLERKIDRWVGRGLADSKIADAAYSISRTYGRDEQDRKDHLRAALLTYSDAQKYFKRLRRAGYKFRYVIAGEYGSTKGRAHWHVLMFFSGAVPPHQLSTTFERRFNNEFWPHGFQYWERCETVASVRYVCKYIQKDVGKDERQAVFKMSKKPPIGDSYFRRLAEKFVAAGLTPRGLTYRISGVKPGRNGKQKEFMMGGRTAENYLDHFMFKWVETYGDDRWPPSEVIDAYLDKVWRQSAEYAERQYRLKKDSHKPPAPPTVLVEFQSGDGWVWEEVAGSRPDVGTDPRTGYSLTSFSDLAGWRYWYRKKTGEGFQWERETIADKVGRKLHQSGWRKPSD